MPTLGDIGEFALLDEVIREELVPVAGLSGLRDDCAYIDLPANLSKLVCSTDAGPTPLTWILGDENYFTLGWYAVLVNASDLASAGASPLGINLSVEAPSELDVGQLRDYFRGVQAASAYFGLKVYGGNLRAAPRFASHITILGYIPVGQQPIGRSGMKKCDKLVIIGSTGLFMAAASTKIFGISHGESNPTKIGQILNRPPAYLNEMSILAKENIVKAATDNSDGLLGSIYILAKESGVDIVLDYDENSLPDFITQVSKIANINTLNLMMGWGDWQVVTAIGPEDIPRLEKLASEHEIPYMILGEATEGSGRVYWKRKDSSSQLVNNIQENFRPSSYNSARTLDYIKELLTNSLFQFEDLT